MKTVILAGGIGTRISEESHLKPKPMIEIGGKPIWVVSLADESCSWEMDFEVGFCAGCGS